MKNFTRYWGEYPRNYIGIGLTANIRSWHFSFDIGLDVTDEDSVLFNACLSILCLSMNVHGEVFKK